MWAPAYPVGETPRVPERLVDAVRNPEWCGTPNEESAEVIVDITCRMPYGMFVACDVDHYLVRSAQGTCPQSSEVQCREVGERESFERQGGNRHRSGFRHRQSDHAALRRRGSACARFDVTGREKDTAYEPGGTVVPVTTLCNVVGIN